MELPAEILHLPYESGAYRMAMGLQARPPEELIELDTACPNQLAQRARLLAEREDDVLGAVANSEAACEELAAHLRASLPAWFPNWYKAEEAGLRNAISDELLRPSLPPLHFIGRAVAEDFCLIQPTPEGALLIAAVLCFPARWVLAEKLGRPLLAVHERVPDYDAKLASPVDRFMAMLKPGRVAARLNWSVIDDPALFQLAGKFSTETNRAITIANALDLLHLRVERQTFLRLPASGCVAFGIRTHVYPLRRVVAVPGEAARLAAAVRALPAEMALYKSLARFRDALLGALARASPPG